MRQSRVRFLCSTIFPTLLVGFLLSGCSGGNSSGSGGGGGGTTTPPVVITTTATLPAGVINKSYSTTLAASGGNGSYTWSVSSGNLPAGLTLSSSGTLSGTPTAAGTSTFTIQAADTESTPQKATLAATLVINGALAVSTTTLPAGQQGVAYSQQLAATGGVSPYTWSLAANAQLPAGLTLSSAGVISGTPTGVSSSSFGVVVTDSTSATATANLSLVINPAAGTIPDGTYAFMFAGTSVQGASGSQIAMAMDGTITVKAGAVTGGFFDENTNTGPPAVEQAITGGTLTNGADGLGQLTLTVPSGTLTFALATPASVAPGKNSEIRMIEFDDTTGTATRGSGVLKPSAPVASTSAVTGSFAFLFSGADLNMRQEALVGSVQTDGAGNITAGNANSNEEGTLRNWDTVTGSYAVDANGRGLLKLKLGVGTYSYSFYQVSPTEWMTMSVDPVTAAAPLVTGPVYQQAGAPFSTASLPAQSVFKISGLAPQTAGGVVPDIIVGAAASDGAGKMTYTFDEYNGQLLTNQSLIYNYTVNPVTGRALPGTPASQALLYVIDTSRAFILLADSASSSGIIEAQSGGPFANANFTGNYLGGSLPLVNPASLNEAGLVAADGNGNVVITTNRSTNKGLVLYQAITGTYAVESSGRVTITAPDGSARIFYMVSPTKLVYLTNDGGGYLGSFEQ